MFIWNVVFHNRRSQRCSRAIDAVDRQVRHPSNYRQRFVRIGGGIGRFQALIIVSYQMYSQIETMYLTD